MVVVDGPGILVVVEVVVVDVLGMVVVVVIMETTLTMALSERSSLHTSVTVMVSDPMLAPALYNP